MKFTKAADTPGIYYVFTDNMQTTFLNKVAGTVCPQLAISADNEEDARRRVKNLLAQGVYVEVEDKAIE